MWATIRYTHPWLEGDDKPRLTAYTGKSAKQVTDWCTNWRARVWRPYVVQRAGGADEGGSSSKGNGTGTSRREGNRAAGEDAAAADGEQPGRARACTHAGRCGGSKRHRQSKPARRRSTESSHGSESEGNS
jgi:hypothetical protein